jgi:hypothetical protein
VKSSGAAKRVAWTLGISSAQALSLFSRKAMAASSGSKEAQQLFAPMRKREPWKM